MSEKGALEVEIHITITGEEKIRKYDKNITRYLKLVGNRNTSVCVHVHLRRMFVLSEGFVLEQICLWRHFLCDIYGNMRFFFFTSKY